MNYAISNLSFGIVYTNSTDQDTSEFFYEILSILNSTAIFDISFQGLGLADEIYV